ncbi:hypothetical protein ACHAW5_000186 [Stephanodiscus triporus]|uniref:FH2 domain-containing protein n=1 Tax=Stephanodiscus triporus TaxID=2934178 RepID=A0ABD3PAV3_9STRA
MGGGGTTATAGTGGRWMDSSGASSTWTTTTTTSTKTRPVHDDATAKSDEYDDEEFAMFVAGLRREVAGDHTELWSGFQSLLGRSPDERVPLHRSHDAPSSVDVGSGSDRDKEKKEGGGKKVRMDPRTQRSLTTIHKHLMENGKVKGKFMTSSSQLVNDKRFKKECISKGGRDRVARHARSGEHELSTARYDDGAYEPSCEIRNNPAERARRECHDDDASSQSRPSSTSHPSNEYDVGYDRKDQQKQQRELAKQESWLQSYKEKKNSHLAGRGNTRHKSSPSSSTSVLLSSPINSSNTNNKSLSPFSIKLRRVGRSISGGSDNSDDGVASTASDARQRQSWMEALKMRQKGLRLKQLDTDLCSVDNDESPQEGISATAGKTLWNISPRKKSRISPPTTPKESAAPPWLKVQLRSTPKKPTAEQPSTVQTIVPNGPWNSSSSLPPGSFVLSPVSHASNYPGNAPTSSTLAPLFCVGDIIDLDDLPKRGFPAVEGEAAIFPLKQGARDPSRGGGDVEKFVIVGKTAMVTASAIASPTGGSRKASVTWWCHRCEIRALTLNVEATGANLAHAHGRTPLLFESADVCLDFAQAFYRGPAAPAPAPEKEDDGAGSESIARGSPKNADRGSVTNDLTEDEELLLDRYRKFSQSDRTKLRLTCLSPQGEMQEMEVALSPSSEFLKAGGGIDGEAATKYRTMMKTSVPAEGVDSKVIRALLHEPIAENAVSTFAPVKKDVGVGELNLSLEEEKTASKYRKMLQMGIPPDAVRHKMTTDEIGPAVIAAVLDETKPNEAQDKLNDEEETIAAKYRNMMKMGVPLDGVQHKMTIEGVSAKIMNAVFDVSSKHLDKVDAIQLSSEEEAIAEKYRKMLKMGVPFEGVKHKMDLEDVDMKIVSALLHEASTSSACSDVEGASANPPKKSTKALGPTLSKEEEAIAMTYRNMLKVCIPKEAVRHKMKQEGVSDKIVDAVLGKEGDNGKGSDHASLANANSRKTIAFHWTTSNLAPELLEQSIFGRTELKKRKLVSINPEELDIKKLEELFQKRQNNVTAKKTAGQEENCGDMARLLDLTRANNIAISLKAFNDFTFRSLAETINDIDPDCKIDGERIQFIPNLLPTAKEIQAIKNYKGEDDKLIPAELFFRQLISIKRIDDKVKVMRAMSTFDEHVQEARAGFKILQVVCGQIMNSEKLIQVLEMVLNIGNLMNAGTLDGGVEAFKFESLPKLSQTKSADGKTTILDYIVEAFIKKGDRQSLLLVSEFPDIQESCRLSIGDLMNDMNSLRNNYELCKSELITMKRDQSSNSHTRSMSKKVSDKVDDPRTALFAAIQSRGSKKNGESPSSSSDPRQALLAAIKNKKSADTTETHGESPASDVQYSPGVHRLQRFLNDSKSTLALVEKDQDAAIRACKALALYCGEEGGERSTPSLLQVLSNFAQSLENGVKRYDLRFEAEKRKAAKKEKEQGKENRQNTSFRTPTKMPKLSSFQPHVGVTDKAKVLNTTSTGQGKDPTKAALHTINNGGLHVSNNIPRHDNMASSPRQALLASIKNRRNSLASQRPSDAVSDRIKHIDTNIARQESRVLLVNRMLSEAPASVKQDFLKGVTYKQTSDPLLKKIYETESKEKRDPEAEENWKPVDPRQELFAALRSRKS